MMAASFSPAAKGQPVAEGLVLRLSGDAPHALLRITHVFERSIYVMPVSTPDMARYALRPAERELARVKEYLATEKWVLGRLSLPQEFLNLDSSDAESRVHVESALETIAPLISQFDHQHNLARSLFTSLIDTRARELNISPVSLRRTLLRYYYFGRLKAALKPLRPGRDIGSQRPETSAAASDPDLSNPPPKRRGRQPIEAAVLGRNEFVVSNEDVVEMGECLDALAAKGKTTLVAAHKRYMKEYFARRHPTVYAQYLDEKHPLPVTLRQYRSVIHDLSFERHVRENVAGLDRRDKKGRLVATGPGEIYEIDATGGRIFLADSRPPYATLGTPIIYIMIDRWSRFIPSIYVTLRPASWEELRYVLLISFTSRKRRFKNLGINITETRWPRGRVCARLVMDRGSEMISEAMLAAAVDGLQIEAEPLPPLCPDGKGIIERVIRELKRMMSQRKIRGGFDERPLDPKAKRAFKASRNAAVHNLREIYWTLIDIVDQHNNSPHSHLEKLNILRRARVRPIPSEAYVWGLENITGIESPPLSDSDYERLLLGHDEASLANGVLMYRSRRYYPANASAERQARLSTSKRRLVKVRVDRSDPSDLYAPNGDDDWPRWEVDSAGLLDLKETTMEEEDGLSEAHRLLIAQTRNSTFIAEQRRPSLRPKRRSAAQGDDADPPRSETPARRAAETDRIKRGLTGKKAITSKPEPTMKAKSPNSLSWDELERRERLEVVERQRRNRAK